MVILHDEIVKADEGNILLEKLRSILENISPVLAAILQSLWGYQGQAITYKEIREAIMKGYMSPKIFLEWEKDYVRTVNNEIAPLYEKIFEAANDRPIMRNGLLWYFNADDPMIRKWNKENAARFVTACTEDQIKALRHVIQRASQLQDYNVDSLAYVIRPMVGLNYQQARANLNYYQSLIEHGVSEKKAKEKSIRYSARQHRYRAQMISRTELAFTYNQAAQEGTKQAQEAGILGYTVKQWCTADDERTCEVCGSLEGIEIEMDSDFYYDSGTKPVRINPRLNHKSIGKCPPAHPHCRCTVLYIEKEPPTAEDLERAKYSPYVIVAPELESMD